MDSRDIIVRMNAHQFLPNDIDTIIKPHKQIDYLSFLPVELWRDIFAQVPDHWALEWTKSYDPLISLQSFPFISSKIQADRIARMSICKSLQPVLEELIYSDIWIYNAKEEDLRKFLLSMRSDGNGVRAGLIKRIFFGIMDPESISRLIGTLLDTHIELEAISIATYYEDDMSPLWVKLTHRWMNTLRYFSWLVPSPSSAMLSSVSTCTHLTSLQASTVSGMFAGLESQHIFPTVTRFITTSSLLRTNLKFPLLKWLRVTVERYNEDDYCAMRTFFQLHSPTLQVIELQCHSQIPLIRIGQPLFDLQILDTLIIGDRFRMPSPSTLDHSRMRTLMLRGKDFRWEELKEVIRRAESEFMAHLKEFIFAVPPGFEIGNRQEIDEFARLLPSNIACKVRIDPIQAYV